MRWNNNLQQAGLLQLCHETNIGQLFIYPLLSTQRGTQPKFEKDRHGKRSSLAYIKIRDQGSQRGLRHLRVTIANGKPYVAWRWRQVITRHHQEMDVGVVPQINEGSALAVWVATPFLFLKKFRFEERSIFAHDYGGKNSRLSPVSWRVIWSE